MVAPLQSVVRRRICGTQSSRTFRDGKPGSLRQDPPCSGLFGSGSVPAGRNVRFGTNLPIVSFESKGRFTLGNVSKLRSDSLKIACSPESIRQQMLADVLETDRSTRYNAKVYASASWYAASPERPSITEVGW